MLRLFSILRLPDIYQCTLLHGFTITKKEFAAIMGLMLCDIPGYCNCMCQGAILSATLLPLH